MPRWFNSSCSMPIYMLKLLNNSQYPYPQQQNKSKYVWPSTTSIIQRFAGRLLWGAPDCLVNYIATSGSNPNWKNGLKCIMSSSGCILVPIFDVFRSTHICFSYNERMSMVENRWPQSWIPVSEQSPRKKCFDLDIGVKASWTYLHDGLVVSNTYVTYSWTW